MTTIGPSVPSTTFQELLVANTWAGNAATAGATGHSLAAHFGLPWLIGPATLFLVAHRLPTTVAAWKKVTCPCMIAMDSLYASDYTRLITLDPVEHVEINLYPKLTVNGRFGVTGSQVFADGIVYWLSE